MSQLGEVRRRWHVALAARNSIGLHSHLPHPGAPRHSMLGIRVAAQPPRYLLCFGCRFIDRSPDGEGNTEISCGHPLGKVQNDLFERVSEGNVDCWAFRPKKGETPEQYVTRHCQGMTWAEAEAAFAITNDYENWPLGPDDPDPAVIDELSRPEVTL